MGAAGIREVDVEGVRVMGVTVRDRVRSEC